MLICRESHDTFGSIITNWSNEVSRILFIELTEPLMKKKSKSTKHWSRYPDFSATSKCFQSIPDHWNMFARWSFLRPPLPLSCEPFTIRGWLHYFIFASQQLNFSWTAFLLFWIFYSAPISSLTPSVGLFALSPSKRLLKSDSSVTYLHPTCRLGLISLCRIHASHHYRLFSQYVYNRNTYYTCTRRVVAPPPSVSVWAISSYFSPTSSQGPVARLKIDHRRGSQTTLKNQLYVWIPSFVLMFVLSKRPSRPKVPHFSGKLSFWYSYHFKMPHSSIHTGEAIAGFAIPMLPLGTVAFIATQMRSHTHYFRRIPTALLQSCPLALALLP